MTQNNTLIFDDRQTYAYINTHTHTTSKPLTLDKLIKDKDFESIFEGKGFPSEEYLKLIFCIFYKLPSLNEYLFQIKIINDRSGFIFPYVNTSCPLHLETEKINLNITAESLGIAVSLYALNVICRIYETADRTIYESLLKHAQAHKDSKVISQLGAKLLNLPPNKPHAHGAAAEKDISVTRPPKEHKEPEMEL